MQQFCCNECQSRVKILSEKGGLCDVHGCHLTWINLYFMPAWLQQPPFSCFAIRRDLMTEVFHYLQSSPLNAFLFWREYFFCSITFAGRSYRSPLPCQHGRMIYDDFGMCNSFYMLPSALPTHSLFYLLKMPNIATSSFVGHFIENYQTVVFAAAGSRPIWYFLFFKRCCSCPLFSFVVHFVRSGGLLKLVYYWQSSAWKPQPAVFFRLFFRF